MSLPVDPEHSTIELYTYKEGLLSGVAHDLCFRAERYDLSLVAEDGQLTVEFELQVEALKLAGQVRQGRVQTMRPKDALDIRRNLLGERVLDAARHPALVYRARAPLPSAASLVLPGELTLCGVTQPVSLSTTWVRAGDRIRAEGEVRFEQSQFGIKPFSAMFGSLRVKDELRVSWRLDLADPAPG